ncbi:hypothetical protein STCU_11358 [Strigomonas culicis]|uniref:Uncharacterized protein n=1 Tax=Strigomonas culicis TaxID=28005 RepID=S9TJ05_9TRYP|nr:hypothetical protein STCU_11358 [Strigomonas culicis]|eukprot:EPY16363.1 hypothetical protein STCU_11358 [Strigomonas culicis]
MSNATSNSTQTNGHSHTDKSSSSTTTQYLTLHTLFFNFFFRKSISTYREKDYTERGPNKGKKKERKLLSFFLFVPFFNLSFFHTT